MLQETNRTMPCLLTQDIKVGTVVYLLFFKVFIGNKKRILPSLAQCVLFLFGIVFYIQLLSFVIVSSIYILFDLPHASNYLRLELSLSGDCVKGFDE